MDSLSCPLLIILSRKSGEEVKDIAGEIFLFDAQVWSFRVLSSLQYHRNDKQPTMLSRWITIIICLLVVQFHPRLSNGNPTQEIIDASAACRVYGIFNVFGSSEIPRCDLETSCHTHSDCSTPGYKCECNSRCGMICTCPPAREDEQQQYRLGGLVNMTRCSGRRKCSNTSDCASLSIHGVKYECVCSKRCGQVCQATLQVPHTRPGRCPRPTFVYDFPLCRLKPTCVIDAHCLDENMKCCQSTCGKKCMLPVYDVEPSSLSTPRSVTPSSPNPLLLPPSLELRDDSLQESFENATDMLTEVTTNFEMTDATSVDNDQAPEEPVDQNDRHSNSQRSSREMGRCRTGLRVRNRPGGRRRRCNTNHPCYGSGHIPVCGTDGLSYANECFLLHEKDRLGVDIAASHWGYCDREHDGGPTGSGDVTGNGFSKRTSDYRTSGCSVHWPCHNSMPREKPRDEEVNFIKNIPVYRAV